MILNEVKGNLFLANDEYVLAHCISADCKMGAGIAKQFAQRNPGVREALQAQNPKIGDALFYEDQDAFYNLVTKQYYYHKPTYATLDASLVSLKAKLVADNQLKLAIPLIGCGLDRLEWQSVKSIIIDRFDDTAIEILVCKL